MAVESGGKTAASTTLATITSGAANTKGSWTELIASTGSAMKGISITIRPVIATGVRGLLDIGVGAMGAEAAILPDLLVSNIRNAMSVDRFYFPIAISSGARISARYQAETATQNCGVGIEVHSDGGTPQLASVTALGLTTATTSGTTIDPGGTANTKGSWTEIVASTAADYDGFLLSLFLENTATAGATWFVDIGTGAGGAETVLIPDLHFRDHTTEDQIMHNSSAYIPVAVSSGTRIAARAQCSITDATDRLLDHIGLYAGVDGAAAGGSTIVVQSTSTQIFPDRGMVPSGSSWR